MSVDEALLHNIAVEEGAVTVNGRHVAYDDANRQHIVAGTHVIKIADRQMHARQGMEWAMFHREAKDGR